jgi:hypothetical protein
MESAQSPAPSRRTVLAGAAAAALTTAGVLAAAPPQRAAAAVTEQPEPARLQADPHPPYTAIVGLL